MGISECTGVVLLAGPSGMGTDMDLSIFSAPPEYRASVRRMAPELSVGRVGTEGGLSSSWPAPYLGCLMALGVAGRPSGMPEREELESELLWYSGELLPGGILFRDGARGGKNEFPFVQGLSTGVRADCTSPGKGMFGADGLRARDKRRASSSAAASSLLFFSAKLTKGVVGDTSS